MNSPENQEEINIFQREEAAPEVYEALHDLKRTGWVNRGVEDPESVKEHTEALMRLADELSHHLSDEEREGLIEMLEVHDWPEAVGGDQVIVELTEEIREKLKANKFEMEKEILREMCNGIQGGEEIMNLWLRFEKSDDPAAVFGRQLDKYQAVAKALEYERAQNIPLFEEFYEYALNFINHPVLVEKMNDLRESWENDV